MKKHFYIIVSLLILSCSPKPQNSPPASDIESTEKADNRNLNGKQIVEHLEKLNFFNLTDKLELTQEKVELEKAYNEQSFFEGALRGETLEFIDNRFYSVDSEELFEIGGLISYLKIIKPAFEKLGLKLNYSDEKSYQTEKHWKHTIKLNNNEYVAFDNDFGEQDWGIAYVKFIEMLNEELKSQSSEERFYPISSQNDGRIVLLTKKQFEFVKENYPNDKEHPKEPDAWKKENNTK